MTIKNIYVIITADSFNSKKGSERSCLIYSGGNVMAGQQEIQKMQQRVSAVISTERVAEKLSTETLRKHAESSVEQTASDLSFIDQVFASRDIVLDDNTKMRLKNARSRAEAHLLVNEHNEYCRAFFKRLF